MLIVHLYIYSLLLNSWNGLIILIDIFTRYGGDRVPSLLGAAPLSRLTLSPISLGAGHGRHVVLKQFSVVWSRFGWIDKIDALTIVLLLNKNLITGQHLPLPLRRIVASIEHYLLHCLVRIIYSLLRPILQDGRPHSWDCSIERASAIGLRLNLFIFICSL